MAADAGPGRTENAGLDAGQLSRFANTRGRSRISTSRTRSGRDLAWRKINKNTWQIDTGGAKEIVAYVSRLFQRTDVRTNELNDDHAFWNNAGILMFPKDQLKAPSTVKVVPVQRIGRSRPDCRRSRAAKYIPGRKFRHSLRFAVRGQRFQGGLVRRRGQASPRRLFGRRAITICKELPATFAKIVEEAIQDLRRVAVRQLHVHRQSSRRRRP